MKAIKSVIVGIAIAMASTVAAATEWSMPERLSITKYNPTYGVERPAYNTDLRVVSNKDGSWNGMVASEVMPMPEGTTNMELRFEFRTNNYFVDENVGHFAIGIRGAGGYSVGGLLGRGIIMGNVTGLAVEDNRTTRNNVVAMESFWADGNNVYGGATESSTMRDNVWYRMTITSKGAEADVLSYTLEAMDIERSSFGEPVWVVLAHREINDFKGRGKTSADMSGFWIAEVFSNHVWSIAINNLQYRFW